MKKKFKKLSLLLIIVAFSVLNAKSQGFLHANGTRILDGNDENFIIRSIGTGNWMIMEGYMMGSNGAGIGTHTEFRNKLEETIGLERTDSFYNVWLTNHFTKRDLDSMKVWGFNSLRPAMHYKWFTLPIEDEPIKGENTWLDKGFVMLDSLVSWATQNEMYLLLDMHGTPGGQGKNKDISDYDPNLPSLWESEYNKQKLVALWYKIAERYANEPYVGGYDMINEINWDFANSGNENGCNCDDNQPIIDIFKRIIDTIRLVDENHLVFVSGNCWGNKYDGLNSLADLDDNLAFTFHKYWTFSPENDLDWILNRTKSLNVPAWMSESGENSNTWFTNAIHLFEENNVGWSWWPVKKAGLNNVMQVTKNDDYSAVLKDWERSSPQMSADDVFQALLTFADNHKIENTFIHYDVIDAMIRQPFSYEAIPFKNHKINEQIFFTDYDLGRNNVAYFDTDTANHHISTGTYVTWNAGWAYRNDGVDIQTINDTDVNNGYNVGWTSAGEWLQYTLKTDSIAAYKLNIRHASDGGGSKFHLEVNGAAITSSLALPGTGGWDKWQTISFDNIVLPKGEFKLRFVIESGSSNLSYLHFTNPTSAASIDFEFVAAKTSVDGKEIFIDLNKAITSEESDILIADFELNVNLEPISINTITHQVSATTLVLKHNQDVYSDQSITVSYNGNSIKSGDQILSSFSDKPVINNIEKSHRIPGTIEAEDFYFNNGLALEDCNEGGKNTGYANAGDYLVYKVHVTKTNKYKVSYRVATPHSNAELVFQVGDGETFTPKDTIRFSSTGKWQNWETQTSYVTLDEGYYFIRLYIKQGEHNLNWFNLSRATGIENLSVFESKFSLYPNPANTYFNLIRNENNAELTSISIYNIGGKLMYQVVDENNEFRINTSDFSDGIYIVKVKDNTGVYSTKLIIQ